MVTFVREAAIAQFVLCSTELLLFFGIRFLLQILGFGLGFRVPSSSSLNPFSLIFVEHDFGFRLLTWQEFT
jgi:hypothetical protein